MYAYGVLGIEDGIFILSVRMMSDARTRVIRQLAYLAGRIYDVTFILDAIEVDILCEVCMVLSPLHVSFRDIHSLYTLPGGS